MRNHPPYVFGHRGFSGRCPENTMCSFEAAIQLGCDGVEFDVQLTRDGVPVILHDETLLRTGNTDAAVKDLLLSELLKIDVSYPDKFGGTFPFLPVPTLEEYFIRVRALDFISNIELKTAIEEYPGIEEKVISLIRRYDLSERVILSSFNHDSLVRCKRIVPDIRCGLLYECRISEPQDYARRLSMEFLHPCEIFLNDDALSKYERAGIKTSPWTVDDPARMRYFLKQENIFAIMTNHPDLLIQCINEMRW